MKIFDIIKELYNKYLISNKKQQITVKENKMITQAKLDELKAAADIAEKALSDAAAAFAADMPKSTAIAKLRAFGDSISAEVQLEYHSVLSELESLL